MKKVKKVTLELSEVLVQKIEKAVLEDGFHSRSEFLRFLIMNYTPSSGNGHSSEFKEDAGDRTLILKSLPSRCIIIVAKLKIKS